MLLWENADKWTQLGFFKQKEKRVHLSLFERCHFHLPSLFKDIFEDNGQTNISFVERSWHLYRAIFADIYREFGKVWSNYAGFSVSASHPCYEFRVESHWLGKQLEHEGTREHVKWHTGGISVAYRASAWLVSNVLLEISCGMARCCLCCPYRRFSPKNNKGWTKVSGSGPFLIVSL